MTELLALPRLRMPETLTALHETLDDLRGVRADLAAALRVAAASMRSGGLPTLDALLDDADRYRAALSDAHAAIVAADDSTEPEPRSPLSLETVSQRLARIELAVAEREKQEERRTAAIETLDRLLSIRCDEAGWAPWEECLRAARMLRDEISRAERPPQPVESLATGKHPYSALITLIEERERLDDEKWAGLHDLVASELGRGIAAAVARGRLHAAPGAPARSAMPINRTTETGPERVSPRRRNGKAAKRAPSASTPRSVAPASPAITAPASASAAASVDAHDGSDSGVVKREDAVIVRSNVTPAPGPRSTSPVARTGIARRPQSTIPAVAQAALEARGRARHPFTANLLYRLALDDRFGLAVHLARRLEQQSDVDVPFLSSRLLRALALAPHVQFPTGEIARLLAEDFQALRSAPDGRPDSEWRIGWQLLLTAAALRPALLAPASGASSVIQNLRISEGLSRLYNYARRIALFGDQGRPLDASAFKRAHGELSWEQEMESLLAEVDAWCAQTPARRVRFNAATHCFLRSHWSLTRPATTGDRATQDLWRIWQSTMNRLHDLLSVLRPGGGETLQWARVETDRLSNPAEIDRLTSGAAIGVFHLDARDSAPREQLRAVIAEAVGLARRWLRLHDAPPRPGAAPVPRRADDLLDERRAMQLRDEVLSRQDDVLRELKALAEKRGSAPIIAGVACCCRSIEQIRRLFDPDATVETAEPDMRHVLHAELLRIPNLALNDAWEPQAPPAELENDLLQLLAQGPPDWPAALEARAAEGDHEATERLLGIDAWTAEERERLMTVRQRQIAACRDSLAREVESTRVRVEEAAALGLLDARDRDHFDNEILALETHALSALRFPPLQRRLTEIRENLERRRQYELERVRQRFTELHLQKDHPATSRIDAALNEGNARTANRFIDLVARGAAPDDGGWVR